MPHDQFRSEMPVTEARPETNEPSAQSPNEALARRIAAAFHRGDLEAIGRELADDITWHTPGKNALAGDHRGREAVLALMRKAGELSAGTLHVDVLSAFGDQDYGVLWVRTTAKREGKHIDMKEALVFAICDGRVTETWQRPDAEQFDAFFA